jgi:L-alanine-DL-glutamate epimerase-like enolase superfamily enzyme
VRIAEVDAWLFRKPLPEPFSPSWLPGYVQTANTCVLYRLRTDEGLEGVSGGLAFADEAKGPVNLLRAFLTGLDVGDTAEVYRRLATANRVLGIRAWFVEAAFWDLRGKAEGRSVAELLGSTREEIRLYASTGEVREPEAAAEHARGIVAAGFQGLKLRTRHERLEEDLEMVAAVRAAVGPGVAIMCDANQAWRVDVFGEGPVWDLERAVAAAEGMAAHGVTWLEEPLDMYDLAGYAELRRRTSTPIAAGELHGDPGLVALLVNAEGVDVVQPDAVLTGGVTGAAGLARLAAGRGLAFSPHTWTNGVGLAVNLHVALAAENCTWLEFPYDPPGWLPEDRDAMLLRPLLPDGAGVLRRPDAPGLGIELDEEALSEYGMPL